MQLVQVLAVLGAAATVSALPGDELFVKRKPTGCASFYKACGNQGPSVKSVCHSSVYPEQTVTGSTTTKTKVVYTTVTPAPSTSTVTDTTTSTATSTTTVQGGTTTVTSGTTLIAPSGCGGSPDALHKLAATGSPTNCLAKSTASSQISSACSCLGITAAMTSTVYPTGAATMTQTITKTRTASKVQTPITQTTTTTVSTTVVSTYSSTSTSTATATMTGFALAYNGNYGVPNADILNLNGGSGATPAFTILSNGTLYALSGYGGGDNYARQYEDGDFVRFIDPGAPTTPVSCSVSDSCLLQCSVGDETQNYLYSYANDERDGGWILADEQLPGQTGFPGPSVVAYPGGSIS